MNTLGKLRKAAGFKSASAFAKHMDIPQATYSRYEKSKTTNVQMRCYAQNTFKR